MTDKQRVWDIEEKVSALTNTLNEPFPLEVGELRGHFGTLHVNLCILRKAVSRRIDELEAVYDFR